jgi:hypothetical protein
MGGQSDVAMAATAKRHRTPTGMATGTVAQRSIARGMSGVGSSMVSVREREAFEAKRRSGENRAIETGTSATVV